MEIKIVHVLVDKENMVYKEMVEIDGEYVDFRWDTPGIISFIHNDKLMTYKVGLQEFKEIIKSARSLPAEAQIISSRYGDDQDE